MVHYNPHTTGKYDPPYPKQPGLFSLLMCQTRELKWKDGSKLKLEQDEQGL